MVGEDSASNHLLFSPFVMPQHDVEIYLDQQIDKWSKGAVRYIWEGVFILRQAKERRIWEALGYDSWSSYLSQKDIPLDHRTVDNYISAYNSFLKQGISLKEIRHLPPSKAQVIAPYITQENKLDLISMAEANSWRDLRDNMADLRHETSKIPPRPYMVLKQEGEYYRFVGMKNYEYLRGLKLPLDKIL